MDASLVVVDALPDSSVVVAMDLLETSSSLCVTRLTGSGLESEVDDCDLIPVPEPGFAVLAGARLLMLLALERRRNGSHF